MIVTETDVFPAYPYKINVDPYQFSKGYFL